MYTAQRVDNSWHVTFNGPGMLRASTKRKLLNLIMTNIASVRDLLDTGCVTITSDDNDMHKYCEIVKTAPATYAVQHAVSLWIE